MPHQQHQHHQHHQHHRPMKPIRTVLMTLLVLLYIIHGSFRGPSSTLSVALSVTPLPIPELPLELPRPPPTLVKPRIVSLFPPEPLLLRQHGQPSGFRPSRRLRRHYVAEQTDRTQVYDEMDSEDLPTMERRVFPHHDLDDASCKSMPWQHALFVTCNSFHEHDMTQGLDTNTTALVSDKGFWRLAWRQGREEPRSDEHNDMIILKTLQSKHNFEEAFFEFNRVDALAMERLTSSPYVVNVYGYCGMSVYTEYAPTRTMAERVDPLSSIEKLRLARHVARGIADVHKAGFVHNDLNLANLIFPSDRRALPKLNDFNLAVMPLENQYTNKPCPFTSHFPNPQWRSPEEQIVTGKRPDTDDGEGTNDTDAGNTAGGAISLTNKIDVYAFGNVLFRFATGHTAWKKRIDHKYVTVDKQEVVSLKRNGTMPSIRMPPRRWRDPATMAMIRIMKRCFALYPDDRPTAKQLVRMLGGAIDSVSPQ